MDMVTVDMTASAESREALKLELDAFFITVQRRAFLMARTALNNEDDALDVVQDAMIKLARKYGHKPRDEWAPLFYRIVQNRITDFHRKATLKKRFSGLLGIKSDDAQSDQPSNIFDQIADRPSNNPEQALSREQSMVRLASALSLLPARQYQAFVLRCWEGLSTTETARAMKCSEGSVKTHYFRALQFLREALKEYSDE
jgi:RNA polymerase sigma-70 factor (ECF subfamily)